MSFKINFLFSNVVGDTFANVNGQVWGWSEGYVSDQSTFAGAKADAQEMAGYRQQLLGHNSVLQYIRIQSVDPPRVTQLVRWFASGPSASGDSDIPNTCLLIRCNVLGGPQRSYFLRGIPDQFISEGGGYFPSAGFATDVDAFFNRLCGTGTFIPRGGTLIQTLGTPRVIQSVTSVLNQTQIDVDVVTSVDFATGAFANIKGARAAGAPQIRGLHKVVGKTTTTISLNIAGVITPVYDIVAKGLTAYPVTRTFARYTGFAIKQSTHRITGRPFGLARGRKPKRV